jgi:hypothetical protein
MDMTNSQLPSKFSKEKQILKSDSINQIKFEDSKSLILKIAKNLKPIVSIDTVVRLMMDTNKTAANSGLLTVPFKIDCDIVYHNIARLLYDSFIAYYLKNNPNTSHFGLASTALEGSTTSLLFRKTERLIKLASNREDIAGKFIRGVMFSVEAPETDSPMPVFTETLVKGLDIHLGLDIAIYGASLNYGRIFIPIQEGGKVIEKIYHNLEQMIQQKLITYDEVNDKYLKISESLLFKEVEEIVTRLRYKTNTRRKLLADLKANTVYLGRSDDDDRFNLENEVQLATTPENSGTQSSPSGAKINEMNLIGHEIGIFPDVKKKPEINRSMKSYGAFMENIKRISKSSATSVNANQNKVIAYGEQPSTLNDTNQKKAIRTFNQTGSKAISLEPATKGTIKNDLELEKTTTIDVQPTPNIMVTSAKNVTENKSFTTKSSAQPMENTRALSTSDTDFTRNRNFASPSTIKFAERNKTTNNQNVLDQSGQKNRDNDVPVLRSLEERTNKTSVQKTQLSTKFSERTHSEHPLPSIREVIIDTPVKSVKVALKTLKSNTTIIENRKLKEQERLDKVEPKTSNSDTPILNEKPKSPPIKPVLAKPRTIESNRIIIEERQQSTPPKLQENIQGKLKNGDNKQKTYRDIDSSFLNTMGQEPAYKQTGSVPVNYPGSLSTSTITSAALQGRTISKHFKKQANKQKGQKELPKNTSKNISKLLAAKYSKHSSTGQKVSREFKYYLGTGNFILPDIMTNEPSGVRNRPTKLIIIGENNHCGGDKYCAGKRILDNDCNTLRSTAGYRGMDLTCVVTMIKIQLDALNGYLGTDMNSPNKLAMRVEDAEEIIGIIRKEVMRSTKNNEQAYSRKEIFQSTTDLLLKTLYANKQISKYFYGLMVEVAETKPFQELDPIIIKKFKKVLVNSYQILKRAEKK